MGCSPFDPRHRMAHASRPADAGPAFVKRRGRRRSIKGCASARAGIAAVELAVCLPILLLLTVASIEACSMIHLKQSLTIAAYEGARVALIPGSATENVAEQCRLILIGRGIQGATAAVTPDVANAMPGTFVRVTVTAPCAANSPIAGRFFTSRTLTGRVEMMKEM